MLPFLMFLYVIVNCAAVDLRAACRLGHAPYSEWNPETKTCFGISGEMFDRATKLANLTFTMASSEKSTNACLTVSDVTNESLFDVTVSLTSVTAERIAVFDFCHPFIDVSYVFVLSPSFNPPGVNLSESLTAPSVFYIMALILLFNFGLGLTFLIFESLCPESEASKISNIGKRMLFCLQRAMDVYWCCHLSSQVSRTMRTAKLLIMMYLYTLFGSVITSNMTTASLKAVPPGIESVRGAKIIYQSGILKDYFAHRGIVGLFVPAVESEAIRWFDGKVTVDGFAATVDEAKYIYQKYAPKGPPQYAISKEFTLSGLPESKAFGVSKTVPTDVFNRFNHAMRVLRDTGVVGELMEKYINSPEPSEPDDIPIDPADYVVVTTLTVVGYSGYLFIGIAWWIYHLFVKYTAKKNVAPPVNDERRTACFLVRRQSEPHMSPVIHSVPPGVVQLAIDLCVAKKIINPMTVLPRENSPGDMQPYRGEENQPS